MFNFIRNCLTFSKVVLPLYLPTRNKLEFQLFFLNCSHANEYVVLYPRDFNLHLSDDYDFECFFKG